MAGAGEPIAFAAEASPSRRLLARLRDVMAASGDGAARLDKIVRLIAAEMGAEVCSAYVMRPGDVLELFATIGLNPEAVHRTRLRVGEGLVGEVAATARSLAIANAPARIPTSPTARRPARRPTIRCSACRSCAAAGSAACW